MMFMAPKKKGPAPGESFSLRKRRPVGVFCALLLNLPTLYSTFAQLENTEVLE